jgi:carbon monoxide dehydrogenase subunit G
MPRSARSETLAASPQQIWELISDPHHLVRWWPGVTRIEAVVDDRFTLVMPTKKGRPMRVDFRTVESQEPELRVWTQEVAGTPFERVLAENTTVVALHGHDEHTHVLIEVHQRLRGYAKLGSWMLRRANRERIDEALDRLVEIFGEGHHAH